MSGTDYTDKNYSFNGVGGTDLGDQLQEQFQLQETNILQVETDLELSNSVLHGTGRTGTGCRLSIGTGLAANISNGYYVVGGALRQINEVAGYDTVSLTANSSNHIYMDENGETVVYSSLQSPNPTGYWYVGVAVADSDSCTSVDDDDADIISSLTDLQTDLDAAETDIDDLESAVGMPYPSGNSSLDARVTALESGGVGGGTTTYWGALQRSSGDATTISEYVASQIGSGVASGADGTTPVTKTVQLPSDIEISNHLRLVMRTMHSLPEIEETQIYSYYFVPGISATGLYDSTNTTATVDLTNHTIG